MRDEDRNRLNHMLEAAEAALRFVAGRKRGDLDTDQMLLFALLRAVEVIGEAAANVSADGRAAGIPWPAIVGMRNRIIHAYFDVNTDVVWKTVTEEIPALVPKLKAVLGSRTTP